VARSPSVGERAEKLLIGTRGPRSMLGIGTLKEDRLSEKSDGPRKIKVVDRRRFDDSGEERPDLPPLAKKPTAPPVASGQKDATTVSTSAPEPGPRATTSPLFLDLIAGLAQQAEILMTGGHGMPAQPAEAQRVIDYLSMLESKTVGNVSAEEKQLLSNVIFQLRSLYIQHTNTK
jgi:hypothetical protein